MRSLDDLLWALRLNDLPPMKLTLEFQRSGPSSVIRKVEREAHQRFAARAVGNEWFSISPQEAIAVVTELLAAPRP